jgi:hypothetical protein
MIVIVLVAAGHRIQWYDCTCFRFVVDEHNHQQPMIANDVHRNNEHVKLKVGDEFLLCQRLTDAAVRDARQLQPELRVEDVHLLSSMMRMEKILEEEMKDSIVHECGWLESMKLVESIRRSMKDDILGVRKIDRFG